LKKFILLLLVVVGLSGDVICEDSYQRYLKYSDLVMFALDRKDYDGAVVKGHFALKYIERSISSCGRGWHSRGNAITIRENLIGLIDSLESVK